MSPLEAATAPKPRAYSYLRFSTPEQAKGDSLRRQTDAATAYAEANGLDLDTTLTFRDLGVSAFSGKNAKTGALAMFVRAIEDGVVEPGSYLLVESLDRVSRQTPRKALRALEDIVEGGVVVVTLSDQRVHTRASLDDAMGLLGSLLVFMRAHEESQMKAQRLRASWENKRAKARADLTRLTSTGPAWLKPITDGFAVLEDRAHVVRRIFTETLAGRGQHRIAAGLTADGVPTWRGGEGWHRTYVRKIVDNAAVIGHLTPHVTERLDGGGTLRRPVGEAIEGYYPPVIDLETWHRARALVGTRQTAGAGGRGRHAGKAVRHSLAGLARCPICAGTMTRVSKGPSGGRTYLVCAKAKRGAGCAYVSVPVEAVESAIRRETVTLLDNPPSTDLAELRFRAALADVEMQMDAVTGEIEDLTRARLERRGVTPLARQREADLYRHKQALLDTRKSLQDQMTLAGSRAVDARVTRLWDALEDLAVLASEQERDGFEGFEGLDYTAVNAAVRETFSSVVVDHEREALTFHWRHGGETELSYAPPF